MNYLAHAFLADRHPENIIGNLAGDFVKGPLGNEFAPRIRRGILLHRKIDSYTDVHPEVAAMKSAFTRERRRFAGIILDIGFDYYLCRNWNRFSDEPLREFIDTVYAILLRNHRTLPPGLASVAPRLVEGDWLGYYQSLKGTGEILDRVATRFRRENPLKGSIKEIENNHAEFEAGFLRMFPAVIDYAKQQKRSLAKAEITGF